MATTTLQRDRRRYGGDARAHPAWPDRHRGHRRLRDPGDRRGPDPDPDRVRRAGRLQGQRSAGRRSRCDHPEPLDRVELHRRPRRPQCRRVLARGPQQPDRRGHRRHRDRAAGVARSVRVRRGSRSGGARHVHAVHARAAVPVRRGDPAAVHPRSRHRAVRQLPRGGPAGGRLRPAADGDHPSAVLPEHPGRARGRRADGRLFDLRVLLARPPAAGPARPSQPSACWRS